MRASRVLGISATVAAVLFSLCRLPSGAAASPAGTGFTPLDLFMEKLPSPDCSTRWEALVFFLGSGPNPADRLALLRRSVAEVERPMQERLHQLIEFTEQGITARAKVDPLAKQVERLQTRPPSRRRAAELDRLRQRFLQIIHDPKEPFSTRASAASAMSVLVTEFAREATRGWATEFAKLLANGDPHVRLAASLVAARGRLLRGQEPEKGPVILVLIGGLRGLSFHERFSSQGALLGLTNLSAAQLCVDPTDPPELRAAGIRRWEEWWDQNKAKLGLEKIPQHWE